MTRPPVPACQAGLWGTSSFLDVAPTQPSPTTSSLSGGRRRLVVQPRTAHGTARPAVPGGATALPTTSPSCCSGALCGLSGPGCQTPRGSSPSPTQVPSCRLAKGAIRVGGTIHCGSLPPAGVGTTVWRPGPSQKPAPGGGTRAADPPPQRALSWCGNVVSSQRS